MRKLFWLFLILDSAFAQNATSTITGIVRDESGGVVASAIINVVDNATGFKRAATTDAGGSYLIGGLRPDSYRITAEHAGFIAFEARDIVLQLNQNARFDITLKIGNAQESVTVSAQASGVQTRDASEGYSVDGTTASALPLEGRNVATLVTLGPGAIPRQLSGFVHDVINDVQPARGAVALNPPVNGARSTMNTFVLDGAYNTDRNAFAVAVVPPLESVQEFRTQSSMGTAEFAQSGGGVVDIVTKTGNRSLHGSLFEYLRNEATDARGFFDDPTLPRSITRQSQFGGALGGPLPGKSTFFYGTYEGVRGESAKATVHLMPDAVIRGGDFTGRATIYDPLTFDAATNTRQPFSGNSIPLARIDPIARRYLQLYEPLPNLPGGGFSNYLDATPNETHSDAGLARVDHQFHHAGTFFTRFAINDDRTILAGTFPQRESQENLRAQQAAIGHTFARASWLNEARISFTRLRVFDLSKSAFGTDVVRDLGIAGGSSNPATFGLPYFVINDFETVTDSTALPQTQRDNTWSLADTVALNRGRHSLKTGMQWSRFQLNYLQSAYPRGRYIFNGFYTDDPANPGTAGDAFADFLLGYAQSTRRTLGASQAYLRQNNTGLFLQDEWRLTPSFTLNLGVRYDYATPYSEARGNLFNLDYSALPKAPRLVQESTATVPDRNNFAPRVGLAWQLPKFFGSAPAAFRAGYGIYYAPEIAIENYDLVRNGLKNEVNEVTGPAPVLTLQQGFPVNASAGFASYYGLDRNARTPYVQQWTASIQREAWRGVVLEAAYVGSKGTKLGRFRTFNTPAHVETGENLGPRPGDLQSLRTFPELGPIYQRQHIANSSYNSLQFRAEKRFAGRLSFLASFTWSKSIDDADSVIPGLSDSFGAQDERNLRLERGLSVFNVGRRLSASSVYNLPAPQTLRPVLRNWTMSGILTLQDGSPWNPVYFGADFANSGTPNRPNVVPGQNVNLPAGQRSADDWFNRDAFSDPAPLTFGNAGRNTLPSPGNAVFDVALARSFAVRERFNAQFRAESFNVLNHPNWGVPGQYPDFGPFFGKIFTTGDPRRFQFALKLTF